MGQRRENDLEAKLPEIARRYAHAVLTGDEVQAELAIREALAAKLSTDEIDDEIIAPALWLVGELWQRGEITVADEHLATEISLRMLALQREAHRTTKARAGYRVMLATPAGEQHVVALRMVGELLREAGCQTVMLGPDVPAGALAAAAARHRPDVVCFSSTLPEGTDRVLIAIDEVQRRQPAAGFVVGGRGITSRLRAHAGIAVCERVSDAVGAVDALVKRAHLN
jgi:methanogenic corrinoid protein MtbC1